MTPLRQRMIDDMRLRNFAPRHSEKLYRSRGGIRPLFGKNSYLLDMEAVRDYLLYLLDERKMSPETVNQQVSALQFLYLTTLEMPWNPRDFPRAKRPCRLPVVLSHEEVVQFFDHVPSLRYRAALMICYGAGLRVSEAVALKVTDIDSQRMLLRVEQGKGRKDRYAMLSPRLQQVLRTYWRAARPQGYLFPSWRTGRHLTASTLQTACRDAWQRSGLHKKVTVHTLRHSFATHFWKTAPTARHSSMLGTARSKPRPTIPPSRRTDWRDPQPARSTRQQAGPAADNQTSTTSESERSKTWNGHRWRWPTSFDRTARLTGRRTACRASRCASCAPSSAAAPRRSAAISTSAASCGHRAISYNSCLMGSIF